MPTPCAGFPVGLYLGSVFGFAFLARSSDADLVLAPFSLALRSKYAFFCASFADSAALPLSRVGCCCLPAGDRLGLETPASFLVLYVLAGVVLQPPTALVHLV